MVRMGARGFTRLSPTTSTLKWLQEGLSLKVHFHRSGGFAGITKSFIIDSDALPHETADELKSLASNEEIKKLPPKVKARSRGADRYQYRIDIEDENHKRTIDVDEGSVPEPVAPLLKWLNEYSKLQNPAAHPQDR